MISGKLIVAAALVASFAAAQVATAGESGRQATACAAGAGGEVVLENFEAPPARVVKTDGWALGGLWHVESGNDGHIARFSTDKGSYATGSSVSGALVSCTFSLQGTGNILTFLTHEEVEGNPGALDAAESAIDRDQRLVEISTDGGKSWQLVSESRCRETARCSDGYASSKDCVTSGPSCFMRITLGLDAFSPAKEARLRFVFDSRGTGNNNFYGWAIDDVRVTSSPVPITFTPMLPLKQPTGPIATSLDSGHPLFATVESDGSLILGEINGLTSFATMSPRFPEKLGETPAIVEAADQQIVYAVGEKRIWRTARTLGEAVPTFSSPSALPLVNTGGPIAAGAVASPTQGGNPEPFLVYVATNRHVFATLDPPSSGHPPIDLTGLLGAAPAGADVQPAVAPLAAAESAVVAVPSAQQTILVHVSPGKATSLATLTAPLGASLARYGGAIHAVYASSDHTLHDYLMRLDGTKITDSVATGLDATATTRPQVTIEGHQLYASWLRDGKHPRVARFDSNDGQTFGTWVMEYTGEAVVSSAPTATTTASGAVSVSVGTSLGFPATYHLGAGWSARPMLKLGAETLRPIESPTSILVGDGAQAFYALDDGRFARVGGTSSQVYPQIGALFGAESSPAAMGLADGHTVVAYEAGSALVTDVLDQDLRFVTGQATTPDHRFVVNSPPAALRWGNDAWFAVTTANVPLPKHSALAPRIYLLRSRFQGGKIVTVALNVGPLPGGRQFASPPVAVQTGSHLQVLVLGDDGRVYRSIVGGGTTSPLRPLPGAAGPYQGRLTIGTIGGDSYLFATDRQRDLWVGRLFETKLDTRVKLTGDVQFYPAVTPLGGSALQVFVTKLDGHLWSGRLSTGDRQVTFTDAGVPATTNAPTLSRPAALLPVTGHEKAEHLYGLRVQAKNLELIDLGAASLHEQLAQDGFEAIWHPNEYYRQPETALDQTPVWNEAAHIADRIPAWIARRYQRQMAELTTFEHVRVLVSPVQITRIYIGARPYRNITADPDNDARTLWEEYAHNLAGWFDVERQRDWDLDPLVAGSIDTGTIDGFPTKTLFSIADQCMPSNNPEGGPGKWGYANGRWRGFTDVTSRDDGTYQCTSNEHNFMYPFLEYQDDGPRLRADAHDDIIQSGNPTRGLLQRKYDWVKKWIYHGRVFTANSEPCLLGC